MKPRFRMIDVVVLLLAAVMAIILSARGLVESTTAAWTDRVDISTTVTGGNWQQPAGNSCVAFGSDGRQLPGCAVKSITFDGWGDVGAQTRNYYIEFTNPNGTRSVNFDVDLSTGKGSGTGWSWTGARVLPGAQFTARDGWTCGQLPRVKGKGSDWHAKVIYFQVVEQRNPAPGKCL